MPQKFIWPIYSIIGIGLIVTGCAKNSYIVIGDFYYINETENTVELRNRPSNNSSFDIYLLAAHDTLKISTTAETASKIAAIRGYIPPLAGDTTVVVFNDSMCYYEYSLNGLYFNRIEAYKNVKISNRHHQFYLSIDSNQLKSAVPCN